MAAGGRRRQRCFASALKPGARTVPVAIGAQAYNWAPVPKSLCRNCDAMAAPLPAASGIMDGKRGFPIGADAASGKFRDGGPL